MKTNEWARLNNENFAVYFLYDETNRIMQYIVLPILDSIMNNRKYVPNLTDNCKKGGSGGAHHKVFTDVSLDDGINYLMDRLSSATISHPDGDDEVTFYNWKGNTIYTICFNGAEYEYNIITSGSAGHYVYTNMWFNVHDLENNKPTAITRESIERKRVVLSVDDITATF